MDSSTRMLLMPIAAMLDRWLGEPARYHPLVGFGWLAARTERGIYGSQQGTTSNARRLRGVAAVALLLLPSLVLAVLVENLPYIGPVLSVAGLYLTLGGQSLGEHAAAVQQALTTGQLEQARLAIARMVSRDTQALDAGQIAAATVESVLENGCDAVFGALFWFLAAGLPGVVIYRLANTLDAMWGYRNTRYQNFGWAAARLDDVLNYIPARLTALAYAVCGHTPAALRAWRAQGGHWKSPNAGPVMAAGAGALQIELGGAASYHGHLTQRPPLGFGRRADVDDIARAVKLVQRALLLWLTLSLIGGILLA
jgi:adenosylcobinamide-phosphate synthase